MTIRSILRYPKCRTELRKRSVSLTTEEIVSQETVDLIQDMQDTLQAHQARGLAAPQIGVHQRVILFVDGRGNARVLINPEVTSRSDVKIQSREGCLSFPGGTQVLSCRPEEVEVTCLDVAGEEQTFTFRGFDSVAVQHEIDHLDGVLFIDHMSPLKKAKTLKSVKNFIRRYGYNGYRPKSHISKFRRGA